MLIINQRSPVAVILILVAVLFSLFAQAQTVRTLAVTGEAKRQLTPDAFNMSFTFEQKGQDLVAVKNTVDKQIQKATERLIDNDVQESHIRSMDVTVYPWLETMQREQVNKGFVYRRTIYFMHTEIDAFDAIIKQIAELGPSQIGQLSLINQNIDVLQRGLVQNALKNARSKADDMASVMGMEVGHVLFMSDGTEPPEHMFERRGRMLMAESADSLSSMPGENTISAKVEVVFEVHTVSSRPQN